MKAQVDSDPFPDSRDTMFPKKGSKRIHERLDLLNELRLRSFFDVMDFISEEMNRLIGSPPTQMYPTQLPNRPLNIADWHLAFRIYGNKTYVVWDCDAVAFEQNVSALDARAVKDARGDIHPTQSFTPLTRAKILEKLDLLNEAHNHYLAAKAEPSSRDK
jgi:hypothetical protein